VKRKSTAQRKMTAGRGTGQRCTERGGVGHDSLQCVAGASRTALRRCRKRWKEDGEKSAGFAEAAEGGRGMERGGKEWAVGSSRSSSFIRSLWCPAERKNQSREGRDVLGAHRREEGGGKKRRKGGCPRQRCQGRSSAVQQEARECGETVGALQLLLVVEGGLLAHPVFEDFGFVQLWKDLDDLRGASSGFETAPVLRKRALVCLGKARERWDELAEGEIDRLCATTPLLLRSRDHLLRQSNSRPCYCILVFRKDELESFGVAGRGRLMRFRLDEEGMRGG
jgi:hypothetical protein